MHCVNCGTYIPANQRFCGGCGTPAIDPEVTRVARPPARDAAPAATTPARREASTDVERTIFTTRPTLLFIKIGYVLAAVGGILLAALFALIPWISIPWWVWLPLALGLLLIPAYYHLRRNMIRYTLTDSKIEIDEGLIARTTRNLPLSKIQDVTVSANIPQRLLGYGNLVIDNASEYGGTTVLRNIQDPRRHADLLLRELRRWQ
ncbi:MAG TPA: PH domain-containing protein [Pyrinomonadaceae bacterium]|jgi:membrane protein YdbS with pleckstrin-like domain